MITKLEQEFFKVFEIEPLRYVCYRGFDNCIDNDYNCHCHNKKPCKDSHAIYPEITDRILLKLICKAYCFMFPIQGSSIEFLKENILKEFIYWQEDVDKSEIQQLFKEKQ